MHLPGSRKSRTRDLVQPHSLSASPGRMIDWFTLGEAQNTGLTVPLDHEEQGRGDFQKKPGPWDQTKGVREDGEQAKTAAVYH